MADEKIAVHFILQNGEHITINAPIGLSILEVAHANKIDLEGACEGSLACSTCHVIIEEGFYSKIPQASDEEEDMLDLAFGLTPSSRLGCQIMTSKDIDGIVLRIPSATRNMMVGD